MDLIKQYRQPDNDIDPIFINRWSPRAMTGEALETSELMRLFEAARWAPSSYNNQPWRFLYAPRECKYWQIFFDFLTEGNKIWAKNASVLIVLLSKTTFDYNGKFARTHTFDAGAAWENFALQGSRLGLVVHGMQGFDYEEAKQFLAIPDEYQVEAMIAVGKPAPKEILPKTLQEREQPPGRKSIREISFEGCFPSE